MGNHRKFVLTLYRTILRLHRGLPSELQALGTNYVRDEFRRHKAADSEATRIFIKEWSEYAMHLSKQIGPRGNIARSKVGKQLPLDTLDHLKPEQVAQLFELMEAAKDENKSSS